MTDHSDLWTKKVYRELAMLVELRVSDDNFDAEVLPRADVMTAVRKIKDAVTEGEAIARQLAERAGEASGVPGVPAGWRKALKELLDHIDSETCTHQNTHRGGAILTWRTWSNA